MTNSRGVVTSRHFVANPRLTRINLTSSHNARFWVPAVGQVNRLVTVGSQFNVETPLTALEGTAGFAKWKDGVASSLRAITVPQGDVTFTAEYVSAVHKRYTDDAALRAQLGNPVGIELHESNSHWQQYTGGRLYWTGQHGVKAIGGTILNRYAALGGHAFLGAPSSDELVSKIAGDRLNHLAGGPLSGPGTIYWVGAENKAYAIYGPTREKWMAWGADGGRLGRPTTETVAAADRIGTFTHFSKEIGSIFWHPNHGAFVVLGEIKRLWATLGAEGSPLGYPVADEADALNGGKSSKFQNGSIYWTNATQAHEVRGEIKRRWENLGWEASYLGYPISDEFDVVGGKRSNFQRGYIIYDTFTGQVTDQRY